MRNAFIVIVLLATVASAQPTSNARKLIEFGWDEPTTGFMRQHIVQMEQTPFDGCVFTISYDRPDGKQSPFLDECWGKRAFGETDFKSAEADLAATPFKKFMSNFLRFDVTPGDVDWFDDFSAITSNARLAAKIAKEGKAAGILFDIEQYQHHLFDYTKQRDAKTKSFDDYAKQSHQRGMEVMRAFQEGYPGLTVFLTYGYSLPYAQVGLNASKLPSVNYGLFKPFLDGMFEAAGGKTCIVDGCESAYAYKTAAQFANLRKEFAVIADKLAGNPDQFRRHASLGFGLWMDEDWRAHGWSVNDVEKNYFTPAAFEMSVREALSATDEYVWIYTEKPMWWTAPNGKSRDLPQAYIDAVRKGAAK